MAAKIIRFPKILGPKTSPSDSPPDPPRAPDKHPGRRLRLLMERFFVRRFYRRHDRGGYWYARVTDLKTGRTFRMSSGEKNLKKADQSLRLRLRCVAEEPGLESAAEPPQAHGLDSDDAKLCAEAIEDLIRGRPQSPPQVSAEWVKDDNYTVAAEAIQEAMRLAERGKRAITPEDLERSLRGIIPLSHDPTGPFFEVAFEQFLKTKDVKPLTLEGYKETGRLFVRFTHRKHVHEVTGLDIEAFLESFKGDGKAQRTRGRAH